MVSDRTAAEWAALKTHRDNNPIELRSAFAVPNGGLRSSG